MNDKTAPIKVKKGCSFLFEGQKYKGGAVRNHTIPVEVVARAKKAGFKFDKITAPDEKPVKDKDAPKS